MADRGLTRTVEAKKINRRIGPLARAPALTAVGAPRVPTRETVASAPGGSGWIPVPFRDALVHPRFC